MPRAFETAMSTAHGAGAGVISPTPMAWKRWVGKGVSRVTLSKGGTIRSDPDANLTINGVPFKAFVEESWRPDSWPTS